MNPFQVLHSNNPDVVKILLFLFLVRDNEHKQVFRGINN